MLALWEAFTHYAFLQHALLAGLLVSIACGVIGTYVVARRITSIAGAIAHSALGGMGIAQYLSKIHGLAVSPLGGALVSAVISALVIGLFTLSGRRNADTVISAVWSIGMAVGIIFISLTPGYAADLLSFLFGDILLTSAQDLYLIIGINLVVLVAVGYFYPQFQALCFDEEYARLRGLNTTFLHLLLLLLTSLTVVILIQVVGLILVIALLALPASIAMRYASSLSQTMVGAVLLGMLFTSLGLAASFLFNLPSGATIIMVSAVFYLLSFVVAGD